MSCAGLTTSHAMRVKILVIKDTSTRLAIPITARTKSVGYVGHAIAIISALGERHDDTLAAIVIVLVVAPWFLFIYNEIR